MNVQEELEYTLLKINPTIYFFKLICFMKLLAIFVIPNRHNKYHSSTNFRSQRITGTVTSHLNSHNNYYTFKIIMYLSLIHI